MTEIVHVPLGDRAYDVHVGPGLLGQSGELIAPLLRRRRVADMRRSFPVFPMRSARGGKGEEAKGG